MTTRRATLVVTFAAILAGCASGSEQPRSTIPSPSAVPTIPQISTASPSPTTTSRVTAPPSPTATPALLTGANLDHGLSAGTYRVADPFAVPFSLTFGSEWTLKDMASGDVQFLNTAFNSGDGAAWIVIDLVDNVFHDPCRTAGGPIKPAVPGTVDGVVAALTHMVGFKAGPVSDVVVGGRAGKAVELTNSVNTETANCTGGPMLSMWTIRGGGASGTNGGAQEQLWVIDAGSAIVIIDGETFDSTPKASQEEIRQIVRTLAFN